MWGDDRLGGLVVSIVEQGNFDIFKQNIVRRAGAVPIDVVPYDATDGTLNNHGLSRHLVQCIAPAIPIEVAGGVVSGIYMESNVIAELVGLPIDDEGPGHHVCRHFHFATCCVEVSLVPREVFLGLYGTRVIDLPSRICGVADGDSDQTSPRRSFYVHIGKSRFPVEVGFTACLFVRHDVDGIVMLLATA